MRSLAPEFERSEIRGQTCALVTRQWVLDGWPGQKPRLYDAPRTSLPERRLVETLRALFPPSGLRLKRACAIASRSFASST